MPGRGDPEGPGRCRRQQETGQGRHLPGEGLGLRRFRTRTLEKTNAEALVIAAGQNVKRLLAFGGRDPKKLAQAAALRPPARPLLDLARRRFGVHRRERCVDPTLFNRLVCFRDVPKGTNYGWLGNRKEE